MSKNQALALQGLVLILAYGWGLPLVPEVLIGPYQAINPHHIAKLMLVILGIATLGQLLIHSAHIPHAFLFTGFLGGFTSSTATVIAMAHLAGERPELSRNAGAAASASNIATFIQMSILIALLSPALLRELLWPFVAGTVTATILSIACYRRVIQTDLGPSQHVSLVSILRKSLAIVALISGMMVLVAFANDAFGHQGVHMAAFLSGLVDAHATAVSVSELVNTNKMAVHAAVFPVLVGLTSNTMMRTALSAISKNRVFIMTVAGSMITSIGVTWLTFLALHYH